MSALSEIAKTISKSKYIGGRSGFKPNWDGDGVQGAGQPRGAGGKWSGGAGSVASAAKKFAPSSLSGRSRSQYDGLSSAGKKSYRIDRERGVSHTAAMRALGPAAKKKTATRKPATSAPSSDAPQKHTAASLKKELKGSALGWFSSMATPETKRSYVKNRNAGMGHREAKTAALASERVRIARARARYKKSQGK